MFEQAVANIVAKTKRSADEARATLASSNPQGRVITPQEVAETVLWLASPAAQSITGQAIAIAGGEVMVG
jgi:NAD(P)-dependent dehydrogenase (short-subunit alcohol dehydrogenase family)